MVKVNRFLFSLNISLLHQASALSNRQFGTAITQLASGNCGFKELQSVIAEELFRSSSPELSDFFRAAGQHHHKAKSLIARLKVVFNYTLYDADDTLC